MCTCWGGFWEVPQTLRKITKVNKNMNFKWPFALSWNPRLRFFSTFFSFFFFFFSQPAIVYFVNCEQCICVLFTVPQITLFSNFFIKNGSHNIIYTFKNYFATVFSVSAKISSIQTHPKLKMTWLSIKIELITL